MKNPFDMRGHPLSGMLAVAVTLQLKEMEDRGGPTDREVKDAQAFGQILGENGDLLLFGGKPGEAAALFNQLAHAVAVLAFCPGGITIFGQHYQAIPNNLPPETY